MFWEKRKRKRKEKWPLQRAAKTYPPHSSCYCISPVVRMSKNVLSVPSFDISPFFLQTYEIIDFCEKCPPSICIINHTSPIVYLTTFLNLQTRGWTLLGETMSQTMVCIRPRSKGRACAVHLPMRKDKEGWGQGINSQVRLGVHQYTPPPLPPRYYSMGSFHVLIKVRSESNGPDLLFYGQLDSPVGCWRVC